MEAEKQYILNGLDCAHCAGKIENAIKGLDGVENTSVNFLSKKLHVKVKNSDYYNNIDNEIIGLIKEVEPDIIISKSEIGTGKLKEHISANLNDIGIFFLGILLFVVALVFPVKNFMELTLFIASYIIVGGEIVKKALRNISKGQIFDENFLMTIATIGAFAVKQYPEAVTVMAFYRVGEFLQDVAVAHSKKSIRALMDSRPDYVNLKIGNDFKKTSPQEIQVGDIILIKPGEKVPLDGKIIKGHSTLDTSALTGESLPRDLGPGDEILSGFVNREGSLLVTVMKLYEDSTVSKILELMEDAGSKKTTTENFITEFAKYYTPIVVFLAIGIALLPPIIVSNAEFSEWLYRALVFLVISCPCALVLSVPLSFFGGIGLASRNGILIKGSNYLEALNHIHTATFDKTGTLTKGVFSVDEIIPAEEYSREELLKYTAYAKSRSNHPIALSIIDMYGKQIDNSQIRSYEEVSGHGIIAQIGENIVVAGNKKLMIRENIVLPKDALEITGTIIYVGINGGYGGLITISDKTKDDSRSTINDLRKMGVKRLIMLTGDTPETGEKIGKELGLDKVYSGLLPAEKVEIIESLEKDKPSKGKLIFVGDGINDAPVLARADIGAAMGGLGSDAAIEAADIVLMTDEPSKLISGIKIANKTSRVVWQNIYFSLGVKVIVLILGATGVATLWEAVFADVGVALLAVLNSLRLLRADID